MRNIMMAVAAASLAVPAGVALPIARAEAKQHQQYREWRGRDGRLHCRRSNGTTGLVVGGVAGAIVGGAITSGGPAGILLGAAGGALAGRAIDRHNSKKRCR